MAAALAAVLLTVTAALTWSRSAVGAFLIAGVVFVSRRSGRLAAIVLAVGLVGAIVLLPAFIQLRADRAGSDVVASPIEFIIGADEARVTAWKAATKMFLASPLVGHGFLSYKELADSFGDPRLGSPHNEVLRLFAEEGIMGGLAILALAGSMLLELARRPGWIGAGLLAGSIGYWLAAMFNNPLLYIQVSAMAFGFASYGIAAPVRNRPSSDSGPTPSQSAAGSGGTVTLP
jgi:O-antigen ligase